MKSPAQVELEIVPEKKIRFSASVREVVEFILCEGDLGGSGNFGGIHRALEGTRGHQRLQKSRPTGYEPEVVMRREIETPEFMFELKGRIDGVWKQGNSVIIEEIKTVQRPWVGPADPVHLGQAKMYAWLYSSEQRLGEIDVQVTYFELETGHTTQYRERFSAAELENFSERVLGEYLQWMREHFHWLRLRDASINTVAFPFARYRGGQRAMAVDVYRTIRSQGKLFVEAPTGIGKTISVLFPAVKAMGEGRVEKIFYLTARTIGRTVAENAVADLRAAGLHFRAVTLTARDKICFNNGEPCDLKQCPFAIGYYDRIKNALRDAFRSETFRRDEIEQIARKHQVCPFELSLDLATWADAIICDYNYLFDPAVSLKRFFSDEPSSFGILIDEAHNLVDRAREMFSAEVERTEFAAIKKWIAGEVPSCARAIGKVLRGFTTLENEDSWTDRDGTLASKNAPAKIARPLKEFLEEAERWLAQDRPALFRQELLDLYFRVSGFLRTLESFDQNYVTLLEREGKLRLFCVDPSVQLRAALENRGGCVLFSATLRPAEYFRNALGGGEGDRSLQLESPFDPNHLALMVHDRIATSYKARSATFEEVASAIAAFVGGRPGNYLVYFPSYEYLRHVAARFQKLFPEVNTIAQAGGMTEKEREDFMAKFQARDNERLVGFAVMGGIFGEGIDLVGERLIGVAVVGVGLPQLCLERDLVREAFAAAEKPGFDYAYTFPGMNRVLQAVGRLIRSETDRGVVLLIDERFARAQYRSLFPKWWQPRTVRSTDAIATVVKNFWEEQTGGIERT